MPDGKLRRVVATRMALRDRFEARIRATPSLDDDAPEGTGPRNRHGMPKLPVGQVETRKWPVLDLGALPKVTTGDWSLTVDGAVEQPTSLSFDDLLRLEQVRDTSDFHCVTTWSRMDVAWEGVACGDILALVRPSPAAVAVMLHGYDGYTTNVLLEEILKPDVLLVHRADGAPLTRKHGGPVRVVTPQLYAWKGAKWIRRIEVMTENRPGFWELRGYSMTAYPWRNDRYG